MADLRMIGGTEGIEETGGEGEGEGTGREIEAGAGQGGGEGGREPEADPDLNLRTGEGKGQEVRKGRSQEVLRGRNPNQEKRVNHDQFPVTGRDPNHGISRDHVKNPAPSPVVTMTEVISNLRVQRCHSYSSFRSLVTFQHITKSALNFPNYSVNHLRDFFSE